MALAGFFAVLGIAGLLHALTVSSRRRGPEFAVLRAIGFRRPQVRVAVLCQALTIVAVGVVVGIPVGLIAGRAVWTSLVESLGVVDLSTTPWLLVVTVIPLAAVVAVVVAWLPARAAAHAPTSRILSGD